MKKEYYNSKIENPKNPTHHNLNSFYLTGELLMEYNNSVKKKFCKKQYTKKMQNPYCK